MPKLDREHAIKRLVAYDAAIGVLDKMVADFDFGGTSTDRVLKCEAAFLANKLRREAGRHRDTHDLY